MDTKSFLKQDFIPRSEFIHVPELRAFFQDEIEAEKARREENGETADMADVQKSAVGFQVRGLTGAEFGAAKKKAAERKNLAAIAEGFLSGMPSRVLDSIREMYGAKAVSEEDALAMYLFLDGWVTDVSDETKYEVAMRMFRFFPVDLKHISNRILIMTGMGHVPGKPTASTLMKKSD